MTTEREKENKIIGDDTKKTRIQRRRCRKEGTKKTMNKQSKKKRLSKIETKNKKRRK